MAEVEDLTDAEREQLVADLHQLRGDLLAFLADDDRGKIVDLDGSMGRVSRGDALLQQQMALAERRRTEVRVKQIDVALKAVADGDYGDCRRCGDPIGFRRLNARPESPFCVGCASSLNA